MKVLSILGTLILLLIIYFIIKYINQYTNRIYNYKFFNITNLSFISISYILIFFGYKWYEEALKINKDVLNGEVLIVLGFIILISIIYINIKKTKIIFGLFMSFLQLVLYIPLSLIAIIIVLAVFAYFSNAKPVYRIDDKF